MFSDLISSPGSQHSLLVSMFCLTQADPSRWSLGCQDIRALGAWRGRGRGPRAFELPLSLADCALGNYMGAPSLFWFLPLEGYLRIAREVCPDCPPWDVTRMGLCCELSWQALHGTNWSFASAHAVPGLPRCDDQSRVFWCNVHAVFDELCFLAVCSGVWVNATCFPLFTPL